MSFLRKVEVNGKKVSPAKVTELALRAADSITLTGFTTAEELYNLLKVNCMNSNVVIDEALKELAITYNQRAARDSALLHSAATKELKESYITNVILMDDKLKMIADVRSQIATEAYKAMHNEEKELLPVDNTADEEDETSIDTSTIISNIAAAVPSNTKRVCMVSTKGE